jgi:hypothetical protein
VKRKVPEGPYWCQELNLSHLVNEPAWLIQIHTTTHTYWIVWTDFVYTEEVRNILSEIIYRTNINDSLEY